MINQKLIEVLERTRPKKEITEYLFDEETGQEANQTIPRLERLSIAIRNTLRKDYDVWGCVSGREGIGKSTMAYHICRLVDPNFDVEKNIVYSLDELQDKIFNAPRYSAVLIDEGMEIFYKRDWYKENRIEVLKISAMARQQNLLYVFCTPRFTDLDELLRNWRVRLWLHMTDRGEANVYQFDDTAFKGDPWHLGNDKERKRHNFKGTVHCPRFPDNDHERYKEIKKKYFLKTNNKNGREEESNVFYRLGILCLGLHEKGNLAYNSMAEYTGIPADYIRKAASLAKKKRETLFTQQLGASES